VLLGRAARTSRRPSPMPRLAPVITYVSPDIVKVNVFEGEEVADGMVSLFSVKIDCLL
jgi:hypothetical protein